MSSFLYVDGTEWAIGGLRGHDLPAEAISVLREKVLERLDCGSVYEGTVVDFGPLCPLRLVCLRGSVPERPGPAPEKPLTEEGLRRVLKEVLGDPK